MNGKVSTIITAALALCFALSAGSIAGEAVSFDNSWGENGFNLVRQSSSGVEVVFSISDLYFEDLEVDGQIMQSVHLPGVILPNNAGAPNLPGDGRYIAIPQGASAMVEIVDYRLEVFHNMDIAPAAPIPLDTDNSPPVYERDMNIYSHNAFYPENPVMLSEPSQLRGVDVVILGVTPFQYNPVTRELKVYRDLRVRVNFSGGNGHFGEDRLRSRFWEPILQGNLLNYGSLPQVNLYRLPLNNSEEDNVEYVIIVPDDPEFIAWADTIKQWRKKQGIITGITTLTEIGGNSASLIENYINNAYNNWTIPPAVFMLLSDYQNSGEIYGITSPIWNNYCVSDNILADVNADDLPEMAHARICAQSGSQLALMVNKFLNFERTPPTNPNFYDQPLIAGGWQTERWFIICCEIVYGFWANVHNKHPHREYAIYSGTPGAQWSSNQNTYMLLNYFGPTGLGYIPETPAHLTNWNGSAAGVNAAINSGAFMLLHRDHGSITGWGEPQYNISNLSGLNNTDLTFVLSINCLTGKYNNATECFAEAFHRHSYGALGIIAASETSYSFVNDTYIFGLYDSMYPEFDPGYPAPEITGPDNLRPCFANASGKIYLAASSWPYNPQNKVHTYHLFHHHGDAFITLNNVVPQNLAVLHNPVMFSGVNDFTVSANEGAVIALTVNNNIIGVAEATGSPQSVQIQPQMPGNDMIVTVTKASYYRYQSVVSIIPPAGPYVVYNDLTIEDAVTGNNNGQLELGEIVDLTITVENLGIQTASNVSAVINTQDTFIVVIDSVCNYGNVAAGSTAVVQNGYRIQASSFVPDDYDVLFTMTATDGDSIWISYFNVTAHSPITEFLSLTIDDSRGNGNGSLDPGENVDFQVTIKNNGTGDAFNIAVLLSQSNPYITIPYDSAFVTSLQGGNETTVIYTNITADITMPQPTDVRFTLDFRADGGYANSDEFTITVGDSRFVPSGPDMYGYRAYDMYETIGAPSYNWVEIAPAAGGSGTNLNLGDNQTVYVRLPWNFPFYGRDCYELSICSNGWIKFGYTTSTAQHNLIIPHGLIPDAILAAFWDDLNPAAGGQVCCYHDAAHNRFIIEWYNVPHAPNAGQNSFQIILLDPAFCTTPSGDGEMLVNYMSLHNPNSSTVGIENYTGHDGLQYVFNGSYEINAVPLENEFTIRFTTAAEGVSNLFVYIEPETSPLIIPNYGGWFNYTPTLNNRGFVPITTDVWIDVTLPDGSTYGPILRRNGITLPSHSTLSRQMSQLVPGIAPSGTYIYWLHAGTYPNLIEAEDCFPFEKQGWVDGSEYQGWTVTGWDETAAALENIPLDYSLSQAYPNPFNPETRLTFTLPEAGKVTLIVFDIKGREIARLVDGWLEAGTHDRVFNASDLSSGVYFARMNAAGFNQTRKLLLLK